MRVISSARCARWIRIQKVIKYCACEFEVLFYFPASESESRNNAEVGNAYGILRPPFKYTR